MNFFLFYCFITQRLWRTYLWQTPYCPASCHRRSRSERAPWAAAQRSALRDRNRGTGGWRRSLWWWTWNRSKCLLWTSPGEGEEKEKAPQGANRSSENPNDGFENPEGIKNDGIKMQRVRASGTLSPTHLEQDVVDSNSLFEGSQLLFFDERVVRD